MRVLRPQTYRVDPSGQATPNRRRQEAIGVPKIRVRMAERGAAAAGRRQISEREHATEAGRAQRSTLTSSPMYRLSSRKNWRWVESPSWAMIATPSSGLPGRLAARPRSGELLARGAGAG